MFSGPYRIVVFAATLPQARKWISRHYHYRQCKYVGKGQPSLPDQHWWAAVTVRPARQR